jgi:protein TonB
MEGRCLLDVAVTAGGVARSVRIVQGSGFALLDRAAVAAVEQWRFVPARRGGQAVAAQIEVPIRFRLTGDR